MSTLSRTSVLENSVNSSANQGFATNEVKRMKPVQALPTEQQLKYLHLQAEVEVLFQQLQTLKQRRLTAVGTGDRQ
jgi:hypothetical protein